MVQPPVASQLFHVLLIQEVEKTARLITWAAPSTRPRSRTSPGKLIEASALLSEGVPLYVAAAPLAAYLVDRDHPEHSAVIADHIKPVLSGRAAVQFNLEAPRRSSRAA
ncbi:antibiotic biosynthesis monooxygenase family protein [Nonomuraea africana]|uniref:hypothetical protein n=1 Tax=Nonomuraea africana TaxID=46171 RepID=UPI0033D9790F